MTIAPAYTARYASAHTWHDAYFFADALHLLHPLEAAGFAARYLTALDDAWHKQQLERLRTDGGEHWVLHLFAVEPPSVRHWSAQTSRPDVILTVLVAAWAKAIESDWSRLTETMMQRRIEDEQHLSELLAGSELAGRTTPAMDEESTPSFLERLLSRRRLEAICDRIDQYQDRQIAWDRIRKWGARARDWLVATNGREDAPAIGELLRPIAVTADLDGLRELLRERPVGAPEHGYRSSFAFDWGRTFGWRSSIDDWGTNRRDAEMAVARGAYHVAAPHRGETFVVFQDRDNSLFLVAEEESDNEDQPLEPQRVQARVSWHAKGVAKLIQDHALGDYGTCRTCLGAARGHRRVLACPECVGTGRLPADTLLDMRTIVWQKLRSVVANADGFRVIPLVEVRSWMASVLDSASSSPKSTKAASPGINPGTGPAFNVDDPSPADLGDASPDHAQLDGRQHDLRDAHDEPGWIAGERAAQHQEPRDEETCAGEDKAVVGDRSVMPVDSENPAHLEQRSYPLPDQEQNRGANHLGAALPPAPRRPHPGRPTREQR